MSSWSVFMNGMTTKWENTTRAICGGTWHAHKQSLLIKGSPTQYAYTIGRRKFLKPYVELKSDEFWSINIGDVGGNVFVGGAKLWWSLSKSNEISNGIVGELKMYKKSSFYTKPRNNYMTIKIGWQVLYQTQPMFKIHVWRKQWLTNIW